MRAEKKGAENGKYKESGRDLPTLTSSSPHARTHTHTHPDFRLVNARIL